MRNALPRGEQGWGSSRGSWAVRTVAWWSVRTVLGSGEYRFRYVADGRWFTDYASNGVEFAKLGLNSLLIVPKQERARTGNSSNDGEGEKSRGDVRRSPQRDN